MNKIGPGGAEIRLFEVGPRIGNSTFELSNDRSDFRIFSSAAIMVGPSQKWF